MVCMLLFPTLSCWSIGEKLLRCHCKGLATLQELPNLSQTRKELIVKDFCHSFADFTR